ncbi:MAG TPA: FecR domain-containing protein [Rhizomicrobium sp.]|nr:FecR domain-containing protein [Rhizomicrobium sp.]
MKDETYREGAVGHVDDICRQAAVWLEQRTCGAWGADDEAQFSAWLNASVDHRVEFLRLRGAWERAERLTVLRPLKADVQVPTRRRVLPIVLRMVAACAVFAVVGTGAAYLMQPGYVTYATTVGGRETLTLDDGSQIELNTDTVVRISQDTRERKVRLDKGEAFFHVVHNAARPFVVLAGNDRVVDLGTKFVVRRESDRLEVAVMEGAARLEQAASGKPARQATLYPGDVAVSRANQLSVTRVATAALAADTAWRQGVLVFRDATLAQAAAELNRYNHDKLVITDAAAGRLMFGGTVPVTGTNAFIDVAQEVLGLRVERRGHEILISR